MTVSPNEVAGSFNGNTVRVPVPKVYTAPGKCLRPARAGACAMLSPSMVTPAEPTLGFVRGVLLRDPDGHVLQIVQP